MRDLYHPPTQVAQFKILKDLSSAQILSYFAEQSAITPESIQEALWQGGVFVNQKRVFETLPTQIPLGSEIQIYYFLRNPEKIEINKSHILYQENGFLAVLKPAWLPIQGSRVSIRFGLEFQLQKLLGLKNLHAVHRLDRETSGVVLFAHERKIETQLMQQFQNHQIKKTYLAVCAPPPTPMEWETKGYLRRDFRRLPQNYYQFYNQEISHSRYSETHFLTLKSEQNFALIQARPKTGRTHQIRVHLQKNGTPIVGDSMYGDKKWKDFRLQLHAYALEFIHPHSGKRIEVQAPIPEDFLIKS